MGKNCVQHVGSAGKKLCRTPACAQPDTFFIQSVYKLGSLCLTLPGFLHTLKNTFVVWSVGAFYPLSTQPMVTTIYIYNSGAEARVIEITKNKHGGLLAHFTRTNFYQNFVVNYNNKTDKGRG